MKPLSPDNHYGRTIIGLLNADVGDDDSVYLLHEHLGQLDEAGEQFYEEYEDILNAAIDNGQLEMFLELDGVGVFRKALECRNEKYLRHVRRRMDLMMSKQRPMSVEKMLAVLPTASDIDQLASYRNNNGFWSYLVDESMHGHMDALLKAGRHVESQLFDAQALVHKILMMGDVEMLKILGSNDIPLDIAKSNNDGEHDSLCISFNYGIDDCTEYLLSRLPDDAISKGVQFPIGLRDNAAAPLLGTFQILDRHARRFGIDLDTYRDATRRNLHDYMVECGFERLNDYLEFQRLRNAEKTAELATDAVCDRQRPRI